MTRSVRDLRELINVSRLSYRYDDEENEFLSCLYSPESDEDSKWAEEVSREVPKPELPKRRNKDLKPLKVKEKPSSPPLSSGSSGRGSPLPPIGTVGTTSSPSSSPAASGRTSPLIRSLEAQNSCCRKELKPVKPNFDSVLLYMDSTVVGEWLTRSNSSITNLTSWLHYQDNFVQFAHFWLSEMTRAKQAELLDMEFSILMDEIYFAFGAGLQDKSITRQDIHAFISALFWEYPQKFQDSESKNFLLNVLVCLCSGKKNNYRALLSDVRCSTKKKQLVQFILAMRAFAIVNIFSGILEFYKKVSQRSTFQDLDAGSLVSKSLTDVASQFAFQAIQKDLPDVLDYLLKTFSLQPQILKDRGGKSLIFAAVLGGKENMLHHLLKMDPRLDVNEKAPSGNTPLHAAVNTGNVTIVKLLISSGADLNAWNPECEGATPLHLAIMSGSTEIVSTMLAAGCDTSVKMGIPATLTPIQLAEDLGQDEIIELLSNLSLSS